MSLDARPKQLAEIKNEQGLSMVEILVALALGSFLMLGLSQVFVANQKTSMLQDDFTRVQESGRIGIEMMVKEVRVADYRGCTPSAGSINSHLDTSDSDYDATSMDFLAGGIGGVNNASSLTIGGKAVFAGSDTLVLRGAKDACGGLGRMAGTNGSASFFVTPGCNIQEGEIVVLANCTGGDMFTVTNRNLANNTVVHNTGALPTSGWIENITKDFSRQYQPNSQVLKPYQKTFFMAEGVNGNSLFVYDGSSAQELVSNITGFQILFGEDSNADGSVDRYRGADSIANFDDVKSIHFTLSVASNDVSRDFIAVANIRNRTL